MPDYLPTRINIIGSVFQRKGPMELLVNGVPGKEVILKTFSNMPLWKEFEARVLPGDGKVQIESDLPGLRK